MFLVELIASSFFCLMSKQARPVAAVSAFLFMHFQLYSQSSRQQYPAKHLRIKLDFFFEYRVRSKKTWNLVKIMELLKSFVSFHFVFLQLITWLTVSCDFVSASVHRTTREFFFPTICQYIVTNKVTLWSASYSACVVYTKTIIHLSVGESGGYLPSLRWIIVN